MIFGAVLFFIKVINILIPILILIIGIVYSVYDYNNLLSHFIGAICISHFLGIIWLITSGQGIGFGDVKLMFTCGLIIGWKAIIVGFLIGCILAVVVHSLRMKLTKEDHKLAFGPYLSIGVYLAIFIGECLLNCYLSLVGLL